MPNDQLLPIKVVFSRAEDYQAPTNPGGGAKFFGDFSEALRDSFIQQIDGVRAHFARSFASLQGVPAVAKVQLKPQAVAKCHRPTEIFRSDTCQIIGANQLGELYVSVTPAKLDSLRNRVATVQSSTAKANLTALNLIMPYGLDDAVDRNALSQMRDELTNADVVADVRCRLFLHQSRSENRSLDNAFKAILSSHKISEVRQLNYTRTTKTYRLSNMPKEAMAVLAAFAGTQNISTFPNYRIVRTSSRILGNVSSVTLPAPLSSRKYGVVGIIDSGTDLTDKHLQAWIVARHDFVPQALQDNNHGSFVAGLIAHGRILNHNDERFPSDSAKIVDFVAFDRDGEITEYDLLAAIDTALEKFPEVKVWNLSLSLVGAACLDHEFSLLGAALDERALRYNVNFVVAAGNYSDSPYRSWPPEDSLDDRICPPADAVRAITVGSLAHLHTASSCVRRDEPSPFTRRGPGPAYLLKPELSHNGGNLDVRGNYTQTGIVSVDGSGHLAENVGTSFACPLVSVIAANVVRELGVTEETVSPTLIKALLIHSAFIKNSPHDSVNVNYRGFGRPGDVTEILNCKESSATIIVQAPLQPKPEFGKRPFPMPRCLEQDGVLKGEVFMTLLYDPRMDRAFGIEYCRSNVNASLGTMREDQEVKGTFNYSREIFPVAKTATEGFEEELIKQGYKWSPLKLYYRKFHRGPVEANWRLTLDMLNRAEMPDDEIQEAVLIVTIKSANPNAKVYSELVREMAKLNWGAQDLEIVSRTRIQN